MKKHFNKYLIMSEEEEQFQSSNTCWICKKLIDHDNEKVRDHCHVTGKFRGAAYRGCNINFQITKNVSVIFHNLRGCDSRLVFCELNKFDVKTDVIPNGLEKYKAFLLGKNLVFIDSKQFINSSFEKLVKNLLENDFKYLNEDFGSKSLELLIQKGAYPYEYMNSFERFEEKKLPNKNVSLVQQKKKKLVMMIKKLNGHISDKDYLTCKKIWDEFGMKNMCDYHDHYFERYFVIS